MSQFGSMTNIRADLQLHAIVLILHHLMSESQQPIPQVGMGCTILMYSDRYPATIVDTKYRKSTWRYIDDPWNPREVTIQEDTYVRTDKNGFSEDQEYTYTPNPNAPIQIFTLRKNGKYVLKGETMNGGRVLVIGHREKYYDFTR